MIQAHRAEMNAHMNTLLLNGTCINYPVKIQHVLQMMQAQDINLPLIGMTASTAPNWGMADVSPIVVPVTSIIKDIAGATINVIIRNRFDGQVLYTK